MVLLYSHRISRVLWYSGYCMPKQNFNYGAVTLFGRTFQFLHLSCYSAFMQSATPSHIAMRRFGLFPFRSPLLRKSFVYFLFLRVLRCFSSPGSPLYTMNSCIDTVALPTVSFLIRISTAQRLFAAPRSFSQLVTSFIGA